MDRSSPYSQSFEGQPPSADLEEALHRLTKLQHGARTQQLASNAPLSVQVSVDNRRTQHRETIETLLMRCEHLPPGEQALVRGVYADKRSVREIAALQRREERSMRRELRRVVRRMLRPEFAIVLTQRASWPATRARVGEAMFLHGFGLRRTATLLGVTIYTVRLHASAIRAIADVLRRQRKAATQAAAPLSTKPAKPTKPAKAGAA